jgi:thioredoxin reductase
VPEASLSTRRTTGRLPAVDVAVIGGGPAGLAATLWSARYRRRVLLVDSGRPRNASSVATHGYLGTDGVRPWDFLSRARCDLLEYPEVTIATGAEAEDIAVTDHGFDVVLDDGRIVRALRLILATGVVDVLPDVARFADFYGSFAFTCPSCDWYEAQDRRIVVAGNDEHLSAFAVGLLDWASTVTLIVEPDQARTREGELANLAAAGVSVVIGTPTALDGSAEVLENVRLADGVIVPCDMLFCTVGHVQHSNLAARVGCEISEEGCIVVDGDGRTSVRHVFAAGDMTPGPHLVQIAAAEGARAGIAAALSLRGEHGVHGSPRPDPEPSDVLQR